MEPTDQLDAPDRRFPESRQLVRVQPGEPIRKINKINYLRRRIFSAFLSLPPSDICDAQAALDDFGNWLND